MILAIIALVTILILYILYFINNTKICYKNSDCSLKNITAQNVMVDGGVSADVLQTDSLTTWPTGSFEMKVGDTLRISYPEESKPFFDQYFIVGYGRDNQFNISYVKFNVVSGTSWESGKSYAPQIPNVNMIEQKDYGIRKIGQVTGKILNGQNVIEIVNSSGFGMLWLVNRQSNIESHQVSYQIVSA